MDPLAPVSVLSGAACFVPDAGRPSELLKAVVISPGLFRGRAVFENSIRRASGARRQGRLAGKERIFIRLHLFLGSASEKYVGFLEIKKMFISVTSFVGFGRALLLLCI